MSHDETHQTRDSAYLTLRVAGWRFCPSNQRRFGGTIESGCDDYIPPPVPESADALCRPDHGVAVIPLASGKIVCPVCGDVVGAWVSPAED